MRKTKANGKAKDSYEVLAKAMRVAFDDSVKRGLIPMEKRMEKKISDASLKTRKAVSNALGKTRDDIRKDVAKQLASLR